MRLLLIGDIIGKPGRKAVHHLVPRLRQEYGLDVVIANSENAASGLGLTPDCAEELLDSGIDVLTSGNHIWEYKEIFPYLDSDRPILRPLNYPRGVPGRGYLIWKEKLLVVNLIGRVFIGNFDCPFRTADKLLAEHPGLPTVIDFHAEATSEKVALGWYLDGRVSAVLGTHTHVGTVDARILPGGSAYITDSGMVGPKQSIIGDDIDSVLHRFLTQMHRRLTVGRGAVLFNSVMVDLDDANGRAKAIRRLDIEDEAASNES
jgi:metallophosphoesterase (TIGR00282 family)